MTVYERSTRQKLTEAALLFAGGAAVLAALKARSNGSKLAKAQASLRQTTAELIEAKGLNKLEPKTGLLNPEAFREEVLARTKPTNRASEQRKVHGLALVDIDDFEKVNNRLNHQVADKTVLLPIAKILKNNIRSDGDLAARFGGDEFLIFLGDTPPEDIQIACQKLKDEVNAVNIDPELGNIGITMAYTTFIAGQSYETTLSSLSRALLDAKDNGEVKNQLVEVMSPLSTNGAL